MAALTKNPLISIHLHTIICFQCVSRSEAHDEKKIINNNINNNNNNNKKKNNNNKIKKKESKIKL